jgi:hypothetical protein
MIVLLVQSLDEVKDSLTELRVICAGDGQHGKLMSHPHGYFVIHRNHSRRAETIIFKWAVMKA